jgi:molybdate transport system ATP-binding protein
MIEIALTLPLAATTLAVEATLPDGATAVMGPSGAGKTSLLEAMAGLRPRTRGRLVVNGEVLLDGARGVRLPPERRRVGYVPQDAQLFPHLSVLQNVLFGARVARGRVDGMLEVLELGRLLERHPGTLSGGERQRVALARALATDPRLLLLDEPLAGLDVALRERVLPYLLRLRAEWNVPILYVTHQLGEAIVLAGRVLVLAAGRVARQVPPLALLAAEAPEASAERDLENFLPGRVRAHDAAGGVTLVTLDGGGEMTVPLAREHAPGSAVTLVVRAEDVLVAVEAPHGLSARNVFAADVADCARAGADVTLRCNLVEGSLAVLVRLTPAAVSALEIRPGVRVWLAMKSHSVRLT